MDKCINEFCPECGEHLYKNLDDYFCSECHKSFPIDDIANSEQIRVLRIHYDMEVKHKTSTQRLLDTTEEERLILEEEMKQKLQELSRINNERRKLYPHSHYQLRDTHLRLVLANEIWLTRRMLRKGSNGNIKVTKQPFWLGYLDGLEEILCRMESLQKMDIKTLYVENYLTRFMKDKK